MYTGATAFGKTVVVSGCAIRPANETCMLSVGWALELPPAVSGTGTGARVTPTLMQGAQFLVVVTTIDFYEVSGAVLTRSRKVIHNA